MRYLDFKNVLKLIIILIIIIRWVYINIFGRFWVFEEFKLIIVYVWLFMLINVYVFIENRSIF